MNFYTWMMKKHINTKAPVGDLARDMKDDREFPRDGDKAVIREYLAKWNAKELQVGLIHPASAGHGLNLQSGGNVIVWFGITWSLELYQQTIARLWRQGQTSGTVTVLHIITAGTVDERILKVLEMKDHTQSALIDAVKAEVSAYGGK